MGRKRHSDNSNEHDNKISELASKKSKNEPPTANSPEGKQDVDYGILTVESYGGGEEPQSRIITNEMTILESYDDSLFSALAAFSHRQGNIEDLDGKVVQKIRQHVVNFATRSTPSSFLQTVPVEENYLHDTKDKDTNEYQYLGHDRSSTNHITRQNPIQSIWSKYCHLVYIQHHGAFEKSNNLPNNNNITMALTLESKNETDPVHIQVKEMYKTYMLNSETPGSLLEVIFASMRYDLNAIVVQYLEKLNKFQVYNINPHLKSKIYLLNTGDIHKSGKWRNLETRGFQETPNHTNNIIPAGIYMNQIKNTSSLVICQVEATEFPKSVTKLDSAFFTRLLLGTIKNEECTFHTENPEFHASNYILASEIPQFLCVSKHPHEQNEVQQIFKGRPIESHSVFPFKSKDISTKNNVDPSKIHSTNDLLQTEQQPLTLNIMLDILNIDDELGVIQLQNKQRNALHNPKRFQNMETNSQYNKRQETEDKIQDTYGNNNINCTGKTRHHVKNGESKLRFTRVKNNDQVEIAVIAKAEFGNPQILIQLRPDGKLTYKSNTIMYFMTLASSSICVQYYDFKRNQWQPSELKTGDFIINSDVCFRLHNTNKDMTQIRCSWFTKNTDLHSELYANRDQN